MNFISRFLTLAAFSILTATAYAIELPVTRVGNSECYYYKVKPKETIFSICQQLGISRSDLVKFNPVVSDGLRAGQTLYFPVDKLKNAKPQQQSEERQQQANQSPVAVASPAATTAVSKARTHLVEKGETIYGITHQYGITEEQLFELNPTVAQFGLKQGAILTLPDENNQQEAQPTATRQPVKPAVVEPTKTSVAASPFERTAVATTQTVAETPELSDNEVPTDVATTMTVDSLHVAVMLPFMLTEETPTKQAQLYTEFYRGFLMAADSLRTYGLPLHISAHDTYAAGNSLDSLLLDDNVKKADLIIAPDNEAQLETLAKFGKNNSINILNIFAVKNSSYLNNEAILQANIPHSMMYQRAVEELLNTFPDYQPVFLIPSDGKTDKMEFISELRENMNRNGKTFVEINYEGMLNHSDLAALDSASRYIFIPASGSQTEFSKIIGALKAYKESLNDYSLVQLFGYPEWITFRKESLDNMHFMNATIYSRFFNDSDSNSSRQFYVDYNRWFGTKPMNAIPVQGILGFDTGLYIIRALNDNATSDADFELMYEGIQNNYHFTKPEGTAGKINDSLYFINFRPSGIIDRRSI
ncbi:MAG: LysM peptidoglycan-binding domain-containing protein [Muribaculum sp.]|nr:LysM peptidoglycan-binding domain-containing protein [Muribaculaceae bacterium]MCM1080709.1 LysM peptidoglycan-binding domain-containing protein [Muribaculum sp.]